MELRRNGEQCKAAEASRQRNKEKKRRRPRRKAKAKGKCMDGSSKVKLVAAIFRERKVKETPNSS